MSDPAIVGAVRDIIAAELAEVTPAMVEAGSRAADQVTLYIDHRGKRQLRSTTEAALMVAIWRAMLAAKLAESATGFAPARPLPAPAALGDRG